MQNHEENVGNQPHDNEVEDAPNAEQIQENARLVNEAYIREHERPDATYVREFEKYKDWVLEQPELQTDRPPFITRTNVDH